MKTVILSLFLSLISLVGFGQTYNVTVSGTVTEENLGTPVANQPVEIWTNDSVPNGSYQNTVFTDSLGYYSDTIAIATGFSGTVYASVMSCNGQVTQYANYSPDSSNVTMDFVICVDPGGNNECQAMFWYYWDENDFLTVHFMDVSEGNPNNWTWNFGDGENSGDQNPVHTYTEQGEYMVSFTITSDSCSSTVQQMVYVGDSIPPGNCEALFIAYPQEGDSLNFLTMQFMDMSVGVNGLPIDNWAWDFGDGDSSSEQNPVHTYAENGTYNVCLTISDSAGTCEDTFCTEVEVFGDNSECQANYSYYYTGSGNTGITYQFEDESEGEPDSWVWDFGDGTGSTEQNPAHTFLNTGQYQICLSIANSEDSCSDTYCENVWVDNDSIGYNCETWFTYEMDGDSAGNNNIVNFEAFTSSQYPTDYSWEFGDGTTGTGQTISHTYPLSGLYEVWLTAEDTTGCNSSFVDWIWIGDSSDFSFSGHVFLDESDSLTADDATVYLMTFDTVNNGLIAINQTQIQNDNGYYEFTDVGFQHCVYFVQAELNENSAYYGNYAPTYHMDAINWEEAWPILPFFPSGYTYNIYMQPTTNSPSGNGVITGVVNGNETRGFLSNVEILLLDTNSNPLFSTRTDNEGNFTFDNLTYGNYYVYTELVGIKTIPGYISLSKDNPSATVSVIVANGEATLGMEKNSAFVAGVSDIYPNPVEDNKSNLDISVKSASSVQVSVVNQFGQVLQNNNYELSAGAHHVQLELSNLPAGIYFVKIVPKDHMNIIRKFIKIR